MKNILKKLSCLMAALFLFTCIPSAFAAEPVDADISALTDEEVYAKLAEAFPEDFLSCQNDDALTVGWDPAHQEVVSYETRALSETEEAVRIAYSNGARAWLYQVNFTDDSVTTSGNATTYTVHIYMSVTGQIGVMYINGLKYTIVKNGNDRIDQSGTGSMSASTYTFVGIAMTRKTENSSGPATVVYSGMFDSIALDKTNTIYLQVMIGNDTRTYSVS